MFIYIVRNVVFSGLVNTRDI